MAGTGHEGLSHDNPSFFIALKISTYGQPNMFAQALTKPLFSGILLGQNQTLTQPFFNGFQEDTTVKKTLSFLTFVATLAMAITVNAGQKTVALKDETPQDMTGASSKFWQTSTWVTQNTNGEKIAEILDKLSDEHDFVVVRDETTDPALLNQKVCVSQSAKPLFRMLKNILEPAGLEASFKGEVLNVRGTRASGKNSGTARCDMAALSGVERAEPEAVTSTAAEPRVQHQQYEVIQPLPTAVNLPYRPDASVPNLGPAAYAVGYSGYDIVGRLADDIRATGGGALIMGPARYMSESGQVPYAGYQDGIYSGGYNSYGYGYYANCSIQPFNGDRRCTHGTLKIDADTESLFGEKILRGIDIYIDKDNMGPVSEFNNWHNKGLKVPVGQHLVQFVQMDKDSKQPVLVYETTIRVVSDYVMEGEPNKIRVDRARMFNGPFRAQIEHMTTEPTPAREILRSPRGQ